MLVVLIMNKQLFIPVEPSTSYETVLTRSISILIKSNAFPPEESGYSSFESMEADDAALFIGSTKAVGGVDQDILRFTEVDRAKENTVSRMGFKDGPDAVAYLGFRAKGASEFGVLYETVLLRLLIAMFAS